MKKQIHKKTIINDDGCEETVITEDSHITSDGESPEELNVPVKEIMDEFLENKGQFTPTRPS